MAAKALTKVGAYGEGLLAMKQLEKEELEKQAKDAVRGKFIVNDIMLHDYLAMLIKLRLTQYDLPTDAEEVMDTMFERMPENNTARLGHLLMLIDEVTMKDLNCIHNIRNSWGHVYKPTLADNGKLETNVKKLSTVGKQKLTEGNYQTFYDEAVTKCFLAIGDAAKKVVNKIEQSQGK